MFSARKAALMFFLGVAVVMAACAEKPEGSGVEKSPQVSVRLEGAFTESERANLIVDSDLVERGRRLFSNCGVCHSVDANVPSPAGPHLEDILGRTVASVDNYPYTKALSALDGVWSVNTVDEFIENPMTAYPGTSMAFGGISDANNRKAIIAYLASLTAD